MEKTVRWRLTSRIVLFILVFSLLSPLPVQAQEIVHGDQVLAGEVLEQNVILNGAVVAIDGVIHGDVFAFGGEITLNGEIEGSLIALGERIELQGTVSGNVFVGAVNLVVGQEAIIGRELYFAGARLSLQEGSSLQRDLYALGLEAQLAGEIRRNVHAVIGPLQILEFLAPSGFDRLAGGAARLLKPHQGGVTLAGFGYLPGAVSGDFESARVSANFSLQNQEGQQSQIDVEQVREWGIGLLRNVAALLILGLLSVWLYPLLFNWSVGAIWQSPWRTSFYGLLVFGMGWFGALLAFFLILSLALFFFNISLPNLGFLSGVLGLTGLGLAVSIFWLAITYGSKLIIAFLVGRWLLRRFVPRAGESNPGAILVGVPLYTLAAAIPYLGWIITVLVTFLGIGALSMFAFQRQIAIVERVSNVAPTV